MPNVNRQTSILAEPSSHALHQQTCASKISCEPDSKVEQDILTERPERRSDSPISTTGCEETSEIAAEIEDLDREILVRSPDGLTEHSALEI